ncbi:hypothetical protein JFL43_08595 [Viridibacillus sp. YIM B01967]|uniref:Uncharacterized protein n=1 Tax=Viridibacillus soli TaxID=2798301 RepID=A0ABS1H671_9BACL|nr:hypothetical protein [Viridibacillus soli]MBK3494919.1 hypothetical protein [Viridibacillus soli]
MGYILPIQPLQATQYAERMNMKKFNFAYVNAVSSVKMQTRFERELNKRAEHADDKLKHDKKKSRRNSLQVHQQFIHPNPAEYQPIKLKITDKSKYYSKYV